MGKEVGAFSKGQVRMRGGACIRYAQYNRGSLLACTKGQTCILVFLCIGETLVVVAIVKNSSSEK